MSAPFSTSPLVGGTNILSQDVYASFASDRENQIASLSQSVGNNGDDSDKESSDDDSGDNQNQNHNNKINRAKHRRKSVLAPFRNNVKNLQEYNPYYSKSYFNTYETFEQKRIKERFGLPPPIEEDEEVEEDIGVYHKYGGIPAPPNKDYDYYKTVITPTDDMLIIYKNRKNGSLVEFNSKGMMQCNKKCPEYFSPVCGTDGITYDNQCKLNNEICKTGGKVGFNYPGYCQNNINKKQYVNYKGQGYNLVNSSYITRDNKRYVYVVDGNLNSAIKKVNV